MADPPKIHISISLTSPTLRFSDPDSAKPHLVVTSTLITPEVLTLDARGARDAGTILGIPEGPDDLRVENLDFRFENFAFHDLSASPPEAVLHDRWPGTCEPADHFVELRAAESRVTREVVHECDEPVYLLKPGHAYKVTLKPQTVKCRRGGIEDILARREVVRSTEGWGEGEEAVPGYVEYIYPGGEEVRLACEDELVLEVEA